MVTPTIVIAALMWTATPAASGSGKAHRAQEINPRTGMAVPAFDQLVRAVKQRDRGATQRIVARMGPGRLRQGLGETDRRVVLAVLAAAPGARGAVLLAEAVADLTSSSDPAVAAAAAHTLGELMDGDAPAELEAWDVPSDVVVHACAALHAAATRGLAAVRVRLAALGALGDAV